MVKKTEIAKPGKCDPFVFPVTAIFRKYYNLNNQKNNSKDSM